MALELMTTSEATVLISTEREDDSLCFDQVAELMQKWFSGLPWN